jgi:hypothetical protein
VPELPVTMCVRDTKFEKVKVIFIAKEENFCQSSLALRIKDIQQYDDKDQRREQNVPQKEM